MKLSVALFNGRGFTPHKDFKMLVPSGKLDTFAAATKRDTYDVDGDGRADFVMQEEQDDMSVRVVFYSRVERLKGATQ